MILFLILFFTKGGIDMEPFLPENLPLAQSALNYSFFLNELLEATSKLAVYREKIKDSKLNSDWFLPPLQKKDAVASTKLEGTQATLDGVLANQIEPRDDDKNLNEVENYFNASNFGMELLQRNKFSDDFFCQLHKILFTGNVRRREDSKIGQYRTKQNYIGLTGDIHAITYIPPAAEYVPKLMENLISYMNNPSDNFPPLIRTAIVHAQMETIHPFDDGNGRIGRMLIPLYLYQKQQISLPYFFISEALEADKFKYYSLLNGTRTKGDWNSWIKFFLETVAKQCEKYIYVIAKINHLYEEHLNRALSLVNSSNISAVVEVMYRHPILDAETVVRESKLSLATTNRYLNLLVENNLLYTDGKKRNRKFYCYELLDLLRV